MIEMFNGKYLKININIKKKISRKLWEGRLRIL